MKVFLAFLMVSFSAGVVLGASVLGEGFEGTVFPPPGWTTKTAGLPVPHAWHRTTDQDYRGIGQASAFVGSASPSAIDEWLISPVVVLAAVRDREQSKQANGRPRDTPASNWGVRSGCPASYSACRWFAEAFCVIMPKPTGHEGVVAQVLVVSNGDRRPFRSILGAGMPLAPSSGTARRQSNEAQKTRP